MSTHSLHEHSAAMGTHHEKNQDSVDSANQLAEWAHRAWNLSASPILMFWPYFLARFLYARYHFDILLNYVFEGDVGMQMESVRCRMNDMMKNTIWGLEDCGKFSFFVVWKLSLLFIFLFFFDCRSSIMYSYIIKYHISHTTCYPTWKLTLS
jgi:hypothetical protein